MGGGGAIRRIAPSAWRIAKIEEGGQRKEFRISEGIEQGGCETSETGETGETGKIEIRGQKSEVRGY